MKRLARASALLALVVLGACADEGPISGPGRLIALVAGPHSAEGAALVVIDEVTSDIMPLGDTEAYWSTVDGTTQVVLINQVGGPLAFQIAVADTTQPPPALVQQVAGPDDELRPDVTAYALEFYR